MFRYIDLVNLQKVLSITDLELQPQFPVYVNDKLFCTYTADFKYYNTDIQEWVIEDVKSVATMMDKAFKLRCKAAELYHDIEVSIVVNGRALTKKRRARKIKK